MRIRTRSHVMTAGLNFLCMVKKPAWFQRKGQKNLILNQSKEEKSLLIRRRRNERELNEV